MMAKPTIEIKVSKYLKEINALNQKYNLWCDFEAVYHLPKKEKLRYLVLTHPTGKLKVPKHYHVKWSNKER